MSLEFYSYSQTLYAHVFRPNILSFAHKNNPKNSTKVDYILFTLICCRGPHTETCRYDIHPVGNVCKPFFNGPNNKLNHTAYFLHIMMMKYQHGEATFTALQWIHIPHIHSSLSCCYSTTKCKFNEGFFLFYFIYFSVAVYEKSLGSMCFGGKIRWNLKRCNLIYYSLSALNYTPVRILTEKQSSQCWRAQCCRWRTRSFVLHCTVTQRCERCSTLGCPRPETEPRRWPNCGPTNCTSTA